MSVVPVFIAAFWQTLRKLCQVALDPVAHKAVLGPIIRPLSAAHTLLTL